MSYPRRIALALLVVAGSCFSIVGPAWAAGPATLTFKEPAKGGTFHFLDNPPEATLRGGAVGFSAGDEIILTNSLESEGKISGKVRVVCTATQSVVTKHVAAAGFICSGVYKIPGGNLAVTAELGEPVTEGAIVGGTGTYAGARGSFVSKPVKTGSKTSITTITLLE